MTLWQRLHPPLHSSCTMIFPQRSLTCSGIVKLQLAKGDEHRGSSSGGEKSAGTGRGWRARVCMRWWWWWGVCVVVVGGGAQA